MKEYLKEIRHIPMLDPSEVYPLWEKIQRLKSLVGGDLDNLNEKIQSLNQTPELKTCIRAYQRFIHGNLRLVITIAKKYYPSGVDLLTLVQYGNIGLARAVWEYDYKRGTKFNVYASYAIKNEIISGINVSKKVIRTPIYVENRIYKLQKLITYNPSITINELESNTGLPTETIERLLYTTPYTVALNPVVEEELEVNDELDNPLSTAFSSAFKSLTDLEYKVLELRHLSEKSTAFKRIAVMLDTPEPEIRKLYLSGLEKLRNSDELRMFKRS